MNDDIGPATGGSIAVEFARPIEGEFGDILNKLKPLLQKSGYKGQLAVNSIVSEEDHKPYFLEFCGRVGYPSFPIDILLVEASGHTLHELFKALANEETPSLFAKDRMSVIASVSVPPFPSKHGVEDTCGQPIDWDRKYDNYFFPSFIMAEKGKMVLAGLSGECLYVTCEDRTLDGAVSMLYDTYMPTLNLKNKMYRTDLGKSAKKRIQKLHEWNLI
jgi:phosphoribosylamine-glycine ligase